MYLCDIHTHSCISPDSTAPLLEMAKAAADKGMQEYCVTDHCDLYDGEGTPVTSFPWKKAKEQYRQVKETMAGRMELWLGLELGSATVEPEVARAILADAGEDLDFVLGSFHNWIGTMGNVELYGTDFHGKPELARQALSLCLEHTLRMVDEMPDCWDSLAHINYPLRYAKRDGLHVSITEFEEPIREIFRRTAALGHAIEVNTRHGLDLDSWPQILGWYRECGGELVTVGSDAHNPSDAARGIPEALEIIKAAGFRTVTTYVKRKPVQHLL